MMCHKYLIINMLYVSKNRARFQRGLILRNFLERCGSDWQRAQALFQARRLQLPLPPCGCREHCRT